MLNPSSNQNISEVDLTSCDKEPIHLLGKIQSIGYLIAISTKDFSITHYSENCDKLFHQTINPNTKFEQLLPAVYLKKITDFEQSPLVNQPCTEIFECNKKHYQVYFSKSNNRIIIEFEPIQSIQKHLNTGNAGLLFVSKALEHFNSAFTEKDLVTNAAELYKEFTQFDRVMVYKFDEHRNGHVIAESKSFGLESFLDLKYPASDIPKQAYQLYLTNKVRAINSVFDEGVEIKGVHNNSPIDLSYSIFRSVSPVHIQYLKNMKVTATHAVSLIKGQKLWGMLICHNYSGQKYLSINQRINTQIFGDLLVNRINILNAQLQLSNDNLFSNLIQKIALSTNTIESILTVSWKTIKSLFECDSILYYAKTHSLVLGEPIPFEFKEALLEKLDTLNTDQPVYTNESISYDIFQKEASIPFQGLIKLSLSAKNKSCVLILKKEHVKTINWAGNPKKPVTIDANNPQNLSPRQSFAKFIELVKFQSLPITEKHKEQALLLRDALVTSEIENLKNTEEYIGSKHLNELLSKRTKELMRLNNELLSEIEQNKVTQQNLELAKAASEQLTKIKSDFLANLSHEMRTPLNGIMGISHILKDELGAEHQSYLDLQIESIERLIKSVNRILEMAKVDQTTYDHQFEQVNLNELIHEVLTPLKILAQSKKQEFIIVVHQPQKNFVTDAFLIHQILSNLASNAIKYTPNGGTIQVNAKILSNGHTYLDITVEDSGIGISEENINKIFDSYFTETKGTKQKDNSFGLGLYLVKNYLNYLSGTIEVSSQETKGSLFHVKIPITLTAL